MSGLEVIAAIVLFLWAAGLSLTFLWMTKRHHEMVAVTFVYLPIIAEFLTAIVKKLDELKGSRKDVH